MIRLQSPAPRGVRSPIVAAVCVYETTRYSNSTGHAWQVLPTVQSHALVVCGSDTLLQMGLRRGEGEGDAVTVHDVGNVEGFQHIAARMPSASFTALPDTTHFLCMVQYAAMCYDCVAAPTHRWQLHHPAGGSGQRRAVDW